LARLAELQRQSKRVKAGVITYSELRTAELGDLPLAEHLDAYERHLGGAGVSLVYRKNVLAAARWVFTDCRFVMVADLRRVDVESWLTNRLAEGMSARSRNAYLEGVNAFCNWCVGSDPIRMRANPFASIPRSNVKADPRRRRRSLKEEELIWLLNVAVSRPLHDARMVRRGKKNGTAIADLRPETVFRLERLGRERALVYKTLILTGLRKGELASLTLAQLELTTSPARIHLKAADEKNREGSVLPVRSDLATDLAAWIAEAGLTPTDNVFTIPSALRKILDRDLKAAAIPKRDDRGRTVDVHVLRTTFCTLLSANGVAPRTAQQAMRHSDLKLTTGTYMDPRLIDVAGALKALPGLPLPPKLALPLAPAANLGGQPGSFGGNGSASVPTTVTSGGIDENALPVNAIGPLSPDDNGPLEIGLTGFEPATS
jgi:integrase